jgi:crotonobetainyl-CoA:carnitine CoA-transferase CaiB-like acyl-CoA transferase
MTMNQRVLKDIRILDFSRVLAGPYATRLLADFGAEVIKVSYPGIPQPEDRFSRGYYNTWNRNKRSITLNLNKAEGLDIARKLVSACDAVVENFTPRVMANWGLDYSHLKQIKPSIIMLSMSAMGHTGPFRDYTGFAPAIQAFSGITGLTSYPDSQAVGPGFSYADHVAGLFACLSLLNALEYRRKTGQGQHIDLSETETMAYLIGDAIVDYSLGEKVPQPVGNGNMDYATYSRRGDGPATA